MTYQAGDRVQKDITVICNPSSDSRIRSLGRLYHVFEVFSKDMMYSIP